MLQLAQRTSAPSEVSVSIRTAVWIVMCSEPVMRAPRNGCSPAYFSRSDMRPGISCCASSISLRPYSARERSATLKSVLAAVVVVICPPLRGSVRSVSSGGVGQSQQALVLLLLPAQPVAGTHALWALCRRLEPGVDRLAHPLVLAQPLGERHVREGALEPGQQLAQCAQALQLARSEDAVARVGPVRLDQPDALEVAEHSRRPAGRLSRFVDGQAVGHRSIGGNLSTIVSRFGGGEILAQALAENPFRGGLELGLLPARDAGEGGCGGLELGLQLGRGDHHRSDGEVDDRGPRIAEAGRDADDRGAAVAGLRCQCAGGANGHALPACAVEAGERLLVVAAVGRAHGDPLACAQAAAAHDLNGELPRAVGDPAHIDGPVRNARRLHAPERVADLLGVGEHVVAPHRTSSPGSTREPGPTTAPSATTAPSPTTASGPMRAPSSTRTPCASTDSNTSHSLPTRTFSWSTARSTIDPSPTEQ